MSILDYMVYGRTGRNSSGYHLTDPNKPRHSWATHYAIERRTEEKKTARNRKRNKLARVSRKKNRG